MRFPSLRALPMSRPVRLASLLLLSALGACGRAPVDPALAADAARAFDEASIEADPLCVHVGPFPVRAAVCPACEGLAKAGFLEPHYLGSEVVQYSLTAAGRDRYETRPDEERLALIRSRFERMGKPDEFDPARIEHPRLCFGRTRFHAVVEALAPMTLGGNTYRSVKLVAVATDTSGLLFDPRLAPIGLPIPARAEAGKPLLYPPQVVTLEYVPGDPQPTLSDLRYGAWVDAP
jgi:hypothetical protein